MKTTSVAGLYVDLKIEAVLHLVVEDEELDKLVFVIVA